MLGAVVLGLCLASQAALPLADGPVAGLLRDPAVQRALQAARLGEREVVADQVALTEIPAPPFGEQARAAAVRRRFEAAGLANVRIDAVGNVIGERRGASARPGVVLSAHLDTVFPPGTDVRVRRSGTRLEAPGIADNGRGLAVLLGVARALGAGRVATRGTITFVADVGEEGLGDLRGVKQLFDETLKGRVDAFVSVDGAGHAVTNVAVGSYRYRVRFTGPGGHSFGAFGLVNPIHALGRAVARIADLQVPDDPRVTFNVGRIGGGTSVNSIASDAWFELDMRSADQGALDELDARFRQAVEAALADENRRWHRGRVEAAVERVGTRPGGRTPESSPIVQAALAVNRALGVPAVLSEGSTDANVPMHLGVPAVTVGGGGRSWDGHSPAEGFDAAGAARGTEAVLLLVVSLAR